MFTRQIVYVMAQGRSVKQGLVIYLASEGGHGMKNRAQALRQRYGEADDLYLVPVPVDLVTVGP